MVFETLVYSTRSEDAEYRIRFRYTSKDGEQEWHSPPCSASGIGNTVTQFLTAMEADVL